MILEELLVNMEYEDKLTNFYLDKVVSKGSPAGSYYRVLMLLLPLAG